MASNQKRHGRIPRIKRVAKQRPAKYAPRKKPTRDNNRHYPTQSAVLEFCICGERIDDPIHIRRRKQPPAPPPKPVVQVGINPDNETARMHVADLLHWKFVSQVDRGVWEVETIRPWPENVGFDASITLQDGTEIEVNLEWP